MQVTPGWSTHTTKKPQEFLLLRLLSFFLEGPVAHAAGGAQCGYDSRCYGRYHLNDELNGFFLTHRSPPFLISLAGVIATAGAATITSGAAAAALSWG